MQVLFVGLFLIWSVFMMFGFMDNYEIYSGVYEYAGGVLLFAYLAIWFPVSVVLLLLACFFKKKL